jgi:glycosyltransferase involved in cell wall biosynthesis
MVATADGIASSWPSVTVCICTHNRPGYVADCLAGLARQTVGPDAYEILVVDSGSGGDVPAKLAVLTGQFSNARLIRVDLPGVSLARNAGALAALGDYVAYIDDDAIPAENWIEQIRDTILSVGGVPAMLGGSILPLWEAPLPTWWPRRLRGILSIIEVEGRGPYRQQGLLGDFAPYGANMVVHAEIMRSLGGFGDGAGREGASLLSDEDVQLAWQMQEAGYAVHYDSRIVVRHQIQAGRLTPEWLLRRMYWQGVSSVATRRVTTGRQSVWWSLPRRLLVALLLWPVVLMPSDSVRLIACRWRLSYSLGFVRAAFGRY